MRAICNTAVPLLMPCNYYPPPKPQAALPPLVACPRLNIQYIRSYLPHLKAVFAIGNIVSYAIGTGTHLKRTRHVVMKNNQLQLDVKSNGARGGLKKGGGGAPRNGEKRPTLQERFTKCDKVPASKKTHHAVATRYRGSVIPW